MNPTVLVLFLFTSVALASRRQATSSIGVCGGKDFGRQTPIPFMRAGKSAKRSCSKVRHEIVKNKLTHACKPREVQVELPAIYDYMYDPSHVSVMRCQGSCGHKVSCMATGKQTIKIAVERVSLINAKDATCGHVQVEDHTECSCTCRMTEADCNAKQEYMPHACMCMCKNLEERMSCLSGRVKVWDPTTCQCLCPASQLCTTGQVWNDDACLCDSMYYE